MLLALSAPPSAAASPARNVQFELPSGAGNVDVRRAPLNQIDRLTAWVRLPAGYDDAPQQRWPVLYLLHGWEDNSDAWIHPRKGVIDKILPADFPAIIVMPESGKGWFTNWADQNKHPGSRWGDYLLDEVVPFMERELRILPGRGNHAIGGLSMGGFGAMRAAAALPSYFGHAISFSGLLDPQDLAFASMLGIAQFGQAGYGDVFGPLTGPYAASLSPIANAREYRHSRVSIYYGTPSPWVLLSLNIRSRGLATLEVGSQGHARRFVDALNGVQASAVFSNNRPNGSHDWGWWRLDLLHANARGLFSPPPVTSTSQATNWEYATMDDHGNAWGLGYRFNEPPARPAEFVRRGRFLTALGAGTVTIAGGAADWDASGRGTLGRCTFTQTLPFMVELPPGC